MFYFISLFINETITIPFYFLFNVGMLGKEPQLAPKYSTDFTLGSVVTIQLPEEIVQKTQVKWHPSNRRVRPKKKTL